MNDLEKHSDFIKCNRCDSILMKGNLSQCIFDTGTSIECRKCGNKYTFNQSDSATKKQSIKFEI